MQFYLTLLDTYLPDEDERAEAFAAVEHIPSITGKAEFCFRWMDSLGYPRALESMEDRRTFLLNLVCFAACIEGLFFFAAFAYVYFLRSKGLLNGLAVGTNWVFRDESGHMDFAFDVIDMVRAEEPELFDASFADRVTAMMTEAVEAETAFAEDILAEGVPGLSVADTRQYLEYVADQRLARLGFPKVSGPPTRSASWSYRMSPSSPTSSSARSPPTRWASAERSRSTRSSEPKRPGPDEAARPPGPAPRLVTARRRSWPRVSTQRSPLTTRCRGILNWRLHELWRQALNGGTRDKPWLPPDRPSSGTEEFPGGLLGR